MTSESDDDVTSTSSDEDKTIKEQSRTELVVREEDVGPNEKISFSADVYGYTIAANMTKCCSP